MRLTALPVTPEAAPRLIYEGGAPEAYLWPALDVIGGCIQPRTDASNLAPELLDPFVFAQFVARTSGMITAPGTAFHGNWRLVPTAARMAQRLDALPLAEALQGAHKAAEGFDPTDLDAFDAGTLDISVSAQDTIFQKIAAVLTAPFPPLVAQAQPGYGSRAQAMEGADALFVALCEWISAEMPRDVLASEAEVAQALRANHDWAWSHVAGYGFEYTAGAASPEIYEMLTSLNLRFDKTTRFARAPHLQRVVPFGLRTADGQEFVQFQFGDGILLAHADSLREVARIPWRAPRRRPAHFPRYLAMADRPRITLDREKFITRQPPAYSIFTKTLKYNV